MVLFAWLGAALAVTAFFMKTMIPLRIAAMLGHICFQELSPILGDGLIGQAAAVAG